MPLVSFVEAQWFNATAVRIHYVQGIHRAVTTAAQISPATHGHKRHTAIGEDTGIEFIPRAVCKLLELGAVNPAAKQVVTDLGAPFIGFPTAILFPPFDLAVGKVDCLGFPIELRREETAAFQTPAGRRGLAGPRTARGDSIILVDRQTGLPEGIIPRRGRR